MHAPHGLKVAKALQRYYFDKIPAAAVKEIYRLKSWLGESDGFAWSAPWWAGLDRLQPGSAAGSQAQESWHRWRLKAHIKDLHQTVRAFMTSLEGFCSDALKDMVETKETLADLPQEPWPDRIRLDDVGKLLPRGRSLASEYHRLRSAKWVDTTSSTTYYAMRRNLLLWDKARAGWVAENSPPEVPPAAAQQMADLFHADSLQALEFALAALGASTPVWQDFDGLLRTLSRYPAVVISLVHLLDLRHILAYVICGGLICGSYAAHAEWG